MEFLAFEKAFTFLLGTGMVIKSFISDRHTAIAKWMREDCAKKCSDLGKPIVQHFFDIWHLGKSKLQSHISYHSLVIPNTSNQCQLIVSDPFIHASIVVSFLLFFVTD